MNLRWVERAWGIASLVLLASLSPFQPRWLLAVAWGALLVAHLVGRAGPRGKNAAVGTLALGWVIFVVAMPITMMDGGSTVFTLLAVVTAETVWLAHRGNRLEEYLDDSWRVHLVQHVKRGGQIGAVVALVFGTVAIMNVRSDPALASEMVVLGTVHLAAFTSAGFVSGSLRPLVASPMGVIPMGVGIALAYYFVVVTGYSYWAPSVLEPFSWADWEIMLIGLAAIWPAIALGVRDGELVRLEP